MASLTTNDQPVEDDGVEASQEVIETAFSKIQSHGRRKKAYDSAVDDAVDMDSTNIDMNANDLQLTVDDDDKLSLFCSQERPSLFSQDEDEQDKDVTSAQGDTVVNDENSNDDSNESDKDDQSLSEQDNGVGKDVVQTGGRTKKTFTESVNELKEIEEAKAMMEKSTVEENKDQESKNELDAFNSEEESTPTTEPAVDEKMEEEKDEQEAPTKVEKEAATENALKQPADVSSDAPTENEQPDEDVLFSWVDRFFVQADKDSVTVGDVVRSIEVELNVTLVKSTKKQVRNRLKDLMTGKVKSNSEDSEQESEEEQEEYTEEASSKKKPSRRRRRRHKKAPHNKKSAPRRTKEPRPRRPKKPSAMKIHAEMLRKRRMEELRVRNEELQLQQSEKDQKRAEQIASRFETNTEELRLQRLEERLNLLQKLDQKRIQVISIIEDEPEEKPQGQGVVKNEKQVPVIKTEDEQQKDAPTTDKQQEAVESTSKQHDALPRAEKQQEAMPSMEATEDSDSESSDEEVELEIVGASKSTKHVGFVLPKQSTALSILESANHAKPTKSKDTGVLSLNPTKPQSSPGKSLGARAALRSALLAKQRKAGNLWLARELGYKTEEEHVRDCLQVEQQKRERFIKLEEERFSANERKQLRERLLLQGQDEFPNEEEEEHELEEEHEQNEEEDEEMAMAKEIENENQDENADEEVATSLEDKTSDPEPTVEDSAENETGDAVEVPKIEGEKDERRESKVDAGDSDSDDDDDKTVAFETQSVYMGEAVDTGDEPAPESIQFEMTIEQPTVEESSEVDSPKVDDASEAVDPGESLNASKESAGENSTKEQSGSNVTAEATTELAAQDDNSPVPTETGSEIVATEDGSDDEENEFREEEEAKEIEKEQPKEKKEKNAAWKAMLQKEADKLKKKKKQKGGLVEEEADEEEEEEDVAGLEDFGFSLHKKKKEDEDEDAGNDKLDADDLENIVDEVSDDEGDEEAGDAARKALEQKEEKERHKEIIRRMREGYDGRRGGIAGAGVGARGMHRFDQLVAADNRDDAKRLGLLNDDELDSDDEGGNKKDGGDENNQDEDEDETALLDKMLKNRFLHRSSVDQELEENFSEDEDNEDDANGDDEKANIDDEEEKEQERLAKRFAKRARMQRLIETHGDDKEFSQMRLIDEDESMKFDLMKIKNVSSRSKRQSSIGSSRTSFSVGSDSKAQDSSDSSAKRKRCDGPGFGGLLSNGGKLSLALQASRRSKPRTSFLGGSCKAGKEMVASVHKSVALSHVVFHTGESQMSKSNISCRGKKSTGTAKRKRTTLKASTSLWTKVSANGFKKRR